MTGAPSTSIRSVSSVLEVLVSEGFRLFFPLAALHAALWPLIWVLFLQLDLPFAGPVAPAFWHANEMIFGTFGAAVMGFIFTAVPEWTDTKAPSPRVLVILASFWGIARIAGFVGVEGVFLIATIGDAVWPVSLCIYIIYLSVQKRTLALSGFGIWLAVLAAVSVYIRVVFWMGEPEFLLEALHLAGLAMLGLLGLALARITVPVTNLILDPSEQTSPFRPHPGRLYLAPSLIMVAAVGEVASLSPEVCAYLLIAAGAAFIDRVAEGFIGSKAARAEVLALAGSSLFAGAGLILVGAARLGAPFSETPAWHFALMGGLGLGVIAVFSIAGLRHTGRELGLSLAARAALLFAAAATLMRALPELGIPLQSPVSPYALSAILWATSFLLWLKSYCPFLSTVEETNADSF